MRFRMVLCSQNDTFMPAQRIQRNPRSASCFRADDEQHRSIGKIVIVRKPPRSSLLENRCLRGNPGSSSSAGVIRTNRILIMARTASVSASRCIHAPINGSDALNGHFGCMSNDVSSRLLISWRSHPSHGPLRNKSTCTHNGTRESGIAQRTFRFRDYTRKVAQCAEQGHNLIVGDRTAASI